MSRNEEFHIGRLGAGSYAGSGYKIVRHPTERTTWFLHYPGENGEPMGMADDAFGSLAEAKDNARQHWEQSR